MKKFVPVIVVVVMALWALMGLVRIPKVATEKPDIYGFGKLPVLLDGRIQPIDSTARNAMQVIHVYMICFPTFVPFFIFFAFLNEMSN